MGRSNSVKSLSILGVLLFIMAPGSLASADPQIPNDVFNARDDASNAANQAAGQAQNEASRATGEAEGSAQETRETASELRHGTARVVMVQVGSSLSASQQLLAEVANYAQTTADALIGIALDAYQRLVASDDQAPKQFKPQGNGHGDVTVQSGDVATAGALPEAGLVMAVAAAGASGALLYYVVLQRVFLFGLFPLLSRIAHSEIYTNEARRKIADLVINEPGLCLNELVERTGYSRNAISYHLFVLEKEDELVSIKDGKYRRYFTRSGKYVNGAKNVVSALRNPTTLRMAQGVVERPGTIQRELCLLLGTTASAACWHAKRLEDLHVIRKERVANTVQYYPGEAMLKYDLSEFGLKGTPPSAPRIAASLLPTP